jgi:hypothetical protein
MRLPVYSDGTGREALFPGATMTREQAQCWGDRHIPKDLKRAGFRAYVFESDPEIHGAMYLRVTFGKDV